MIAMDVVGECVSLGGALEQRHHIKQGWDEQIEYVRDQVSSAVADDIVDKLWKSFVNQVKDPTEPKPTSESPFRHWVSCDVVNLDSWVKEHIPSEVAFLREGGANRKSLNKRLAIIGQDTCEKIRIGFVKIARQEGNGQLMDFRVEWKDSSGGAFSSVNKCSFGKSNQGIQVSLNVKTDVQKGFWHSVLRS